MVQRMRQLRSDVPKLVDEARFALSMRGFTEKHFDLARRVFDPDVEVRKQTARMLPALPGTFDFVFLDAWKKDYKRFLDLVLPRLEGGGVFLAHNVVNKGKDMPDFLDAIQRYPNLLTSIVTPAGEGISISFNRR